ncbi:hypothetical protein [Marmoricola sp. RAF53]|uniref:hypothetical protein n=1 Tax=Marmoricola sp. RAF53 TaxID=3233059 RepID=UPI003F9A8A77
MTSDDPNAPVADDDFPEFSAPPRHRPPATHKAMEKAAAPVSDEQSAVDDVIARLRRERAEGKR